MSKRGRQLAGNRDFLTFLPLLLAKVADSVLERMVIRQGFWWLHLERFVQVNIHDVLKGNSSP